MPSLTHRILLCLLLPSLFLLFFIFGRQNLEIFSVTGIIGVSTLLIVGFQNRSQNFHLNNVDGLLLLYTVWIFTTLLWTSVATLSSVCIWILAMLPLSFFLTQGLLKNNKDWYWLYGIFVSLLCGLGIWAVYQYWILNELPQASLQNKNLLARLLGALILPLSAYYLNLRSQKNNPRLALVILCLIFLMTFSFGTIYARMASVSLGGLFLLTLGILVKSKQLRFGMIIPLVIVLVMSYSLARFPITMHYQLPHFSFQSHSEKSTEIAKASTTPPPVYLTSPLNESGSERLLLWKGTWQLIQGHPFLGSGFGSFPEEYASIRPADSISLGFFAHNDFLQMWSEGGLPAALLLFLIPLLAFYYSFKLFKKKIPKTKCTEAVFITAGIALIYLDSLVCFDLYSQFSLILIGILLARLQFLYKQYGKQGMQISFVKNIRPFIASLLFIFLFLLSTLYFVSIALTDHLAKKGFTLLEKNKTLEVMQISEWLQLLRPRYEMGYLLSAEVDIRNMKSPVLGLEAQKELYQHVQATLNKAEKTNRFDPTITLLRARLMINNKAWLPDANLKIAAKIAEALRLDPRFDEARFVYANYLYDEKKPLQARAVLKEGLEYHKKTIQNSLDVEKTQAYRKTVSELLDQSPKSPSRGGVPRGRGG